MQCRPLSPWRALACLCGTAACAASDLRLEAQVVPYVKTPQPAVAAMLELAQIQEKDVVYDLGCGDARLVLAAVDRAGATRGVGVEIAPEIAAEARQRVREHGLQDRIVILEQDLFATDLGPASVAMLYLLFTVNMRLRPKLIRELRPGARVVSHTFNMGDAWIPDDKRVVVAEKPHTVYAWVVPAAVGGIWHVETERETRVPLTLRFEQSFQKVAGEGYAGATHEVLTQVQLRGTRLGFTFNAALFQMEGPCRFEAEVTGTTMRGTVRGAQGKAMAWSAVREQVEVAGTWEWHEEERTVRLEITREARGYRARMSDDRGTRAVPDLYVWGASLFFALGHVGSGRPSAVYRAFLQEDRLEGMRQSSNRAESPFSARRLGNAPASQATGQRGGIAARRHRHGEDGPNCPSTRSASPTIACREYRFNLLRLARKFWQTRT